MAANLKRGGSLSSQSQWDSLAYTSETFLDHNLDCPFPHLDSSLDRHDLRQSVYELFFATSRSSARTNGHHTSDAAPVALDTTTYSSVTQPNLPPSASKPLIQPSKIKKALGLKPARRPRWSSGGGGARPRRPMTVAELMRQQMRMPETFDHRLRKTLTRAGVGQMGRRAETVVLPLELLRHLKPSEFNDSYEYHMWQKRQLKMLEAGLVLHPTIPINPSNAAALRLRDLVRSADLKAIESGKNSDTIRALSSSVAALTSRGGTAVETCHWVDGFPLNLHLYLALLQSVFDYKDETVVVDEVDEMIEMMKKTWTMLGIDKAVHNVCFTWLLFQQFVVTGQTEQDMLCAVIAMLPEVADDARNADKDIVHFKILTSTLTSMIGWMEKRLMDYHGSFRNVTIETMENLLPLALTAAAILHNGGVSNNCDSDLLPDSTGNQVDYYIRSSMRNAFAKILETHNATSGSKEDEEEDTNKQSKDDRLSESLARLVDESEELAAKEKEIFTPILKKWHPNAAGVAAATLHNCYAFLLKQFLDNVTVITIEAAHVLQEAGRLEKSLLQMVVEDTANSEDGGKPILKEMVPFQVNGIIPTLMKSWIEDKLSKIKEFINIAKDTETWNPKSKLEAYAQSTVELMSMSKVTVDDFFKIPIVVSEDMVQNLAAGLENLFQEYTTFVASCGSKQNYVPPLPPLTRCNQDSRIMKIWIKARPCRSISDQKDYCVGDVHNPRPSTSRGTQRLYIRLNTLHYLHGQLYSLDKSLTHSPRSLLPVAMKPRRRLPPVASSYFDLARASILTVTNHVAEVAAYRLIFHDSNCVFYDSLYLGEVARARIRPALRTLKQNLTLLVAILTDRAQPMALKELMKASFEAFLMVLLAGGPTQTYLRSDYDMVSEDFLNLKRMFYTCGEGLVAEEMVEKEAEVVEGVVALMGQATEQLVEDFSIVACEASGLGIVTAGGQKVPMPPTTGRWNRMDPNTILRVLCHRTDESANRFLKKTFQLAKRR